MTEKYELSRRKALAALGTIGVAGAGAGMGTSALYFDEETFGNNVIQAGTTNLIVSGEIVVDHIGGAGSVELRDSEADGEAAMGLLVQDLKPGDCFVLCLNVEVEDNPMYVGTMAENTVSLDNGITEPEDNHGTDGIPNNGSDGTQDGDLEDEMMVTAGWDQGANNNDWENRDVCDIPNSELGPVSLADFASVASGGLLYRGQDPSNSGNPPGHGTSNDAPTRIGDVGNSDTDQVTTYLKFELPATSGNITQGDSFAWDQVWYAEQVRNNAAPSDVGDLSDGGSPNGT